MTDISKSERVSIRFRSEIDEIRRANQWLHHPGNTELIEQFNREYAINEKLLRDINQQLNSPGMRSALKTFQAAARIVWPDTGKPQSKLSYRVEPAQPKIEQRQSGIAVVRHDILTVQVSENPPLPDVDGWDALFHWYYRAPREFTPDGLYTLSNKTGYSYGYIRIKHSHYVEQYGNHSIQNT